MADRERTRHKHLHSVPTSGLGSSGSFAATRRDESTLTLVPETVEEADRRSYVESVEVVGDDRFVIMVDRVALVPRLVEAHVSYGRVQSITIGDGRRSHTWTGLDLIATDESTPDLPSWVSPVLLARGVDVDTERDLLHAQIGNALDESLLADRYPVQKASEVRRGEGYDFFEYRAYHKSRAGSLKVRHGMVTGYWLNPETGREEPVLFETLPGARGEFTDAERDEFMLRTRKQIALRQARSRTLA